MQGQGITIRPVTSDVAQFIVPHGEMNRAAVALGLLAGLAQSGKRICYFRVGLSFSGLNRASCSLVNLTGFAFSP